MQPFDGISHCMFALCLPALEFEVLPCWVYSLAPHTVASNEKCRYVLFWNADFTLSIIWCLGWLVLAEMCRTARTNDAACHLLILNDLVSRAAFVCNSNKERHVYFASAIFLHTLVLDILSDVLSTSGTGCNRFNIFKLSCQWIKKRIVRCDECIRMH